MKRFLLFCILIWMVSPACHAQYKLYEDGLKKYKDGDFEASATLLTQFLGKPTHDKKFDADAYYYRALSYFKKTNYTAAIPDLEKSIELNHPNTGNIHWFTAKCHEHLGQHSLAVTQYNSAIAILKTDKAAHAKLLFERGQIHKTMGNTTAAFDDFTTAASLNPDDLSIRQELDLISRQLNGAVAKNEPKKNDASLQKNTTVPVKEEKKPVVTESRDYGKEKKPEEKKTVDKKPETREPVKEVPVVAEVKSALEELYGNEKRYALVIGNSAYPREVGALRNPVNDATDLAKELKNSRFEVELLTNCTYIQLREAMRKFNEKLGNGPKDQTVGLFYYAGHGVQHDDENYLVPIDAKVEFEDDIPRMCFPVQRMVLANMERSNSRMSIVVLDACRNNPFPAANRSLGDSQGLGEMKRARGSFIAYATAPGSVASDGPGRNGLYTQELLKALKKPGLTIEQVFKEVRLNVLRLSKDKQLTWDNSNIIGDFYFKF